MALAHVQSFVAGLLIAFVLLSATSVVQPLGAAPVVSSFSVSTSCAPCPARAPCALSPPDTERRSCQSMSDALQMTFNPGTGAFSAGAADAAQQEWWNAHRCATAPRNSTLFAEGPSGSRDPPAEVEGFELDMARLCERVRDARLSQSLLMHLSMSTLFWCESFLLVRRRGYTEAVDRTQPYYRYGSAERGYSNYGPWQMSIEQYGAIRTALATTAAASNLGARGNVGGPSLLLFGCGSDTPLWSHLLRYLSGRLVIVEDNDEWMKTCQSKLDTSSGLSGDATKRRAQVVLPITYSTSAAQVNSALAAVALDARAGADEGDEKFVARAKELRQILGGAALPEDPRAHAGAARAFSVIVVDGPGAKYGRAQSLLAALRIAYASPVGHSTHVFLHDAARPGETLLAATLLGHDAATYVGNARPTKGLKWWRVPGRGVEVVV